MSLVRGRDPVVGDETSGLAEPVIRQWVDERGPSPCRGENPDTGMSHIGFRCVMAAWPDNGGRQKE